MTRVLHNIGKSPSDEPRVASNYNTREEVEACSDHLTFDGVYESVWKNRAILNGKEFTLFVMGDYVGLTNRFDVDMPLEHYCSNTQLIDIAARGGKIGWHTWSHKDLTTLDIDEAKREMTMPEEWVEAGTCRDFAYPYGAFNEDLKKLAEDLGYKRAWSTTQGDGTQFALKRHYL